MTTLIPEDQVEHNKYKEMNVLTTLKYTKDHEGSIKETSTEVLLILPSIELGDIACWDRDSGEGAWPRRAIERYFGVPVRGPWKRNMAAELLEQWFLRQGMDDQIELVRQRLMNFDEGYKKFL